MFVILLINPLGRGAQAIEAVHVANNDGVHQVLQAVIEDHFEEPLPKKALEVIESFNPVVLTPTETDIRQLVENVNAAIKIDEGSVHAFQYSFQFELHQFFPI